MEIIVSMYLFTTLDLFNDITWRVKPYVVTNNCDKPHIVLNIQTVSFPPFEMFLTANSH